MGTKNQDVISIDVNNRVYLTLWLAEEHFVLEQWTFFLREMKKQ